jgi:hypothetical protein
MFCFFLTPISYAFDANNIRRSVTFDDDAVQTLESHEHVKAVEPDSEMRTQ